MTRNFALWTAILAGPIVWLVSFEANFALAPWACLFQAKLALYIVSILALVLAGGSGMLAWRQWSELGREQPGEGAGALPRSRIMALGGLLLSSLFFLVILAQAIPEVILQACE
jgi:hypothetical protein